MSVRTCSYIFIFTCKHTYVRMYAYIWWMLETLSVNCSLGCMDKLILYKHCVLNFTLNLGM